MKIMLKNLRGMVHWYNPYMGPWDLKGCGFKVNGVQVKLMLALYH